MKKIRQVSLFVISFTLLFTIQVDANLKVVTTFSILADFAKQVGGQLVEVESIVPFGGDPHSWEPTPREAKLIAAADVLFCNGLGLESWIQRLIANAAREDLLIVTLSDGLTQLPNAAAFNNEQAVDEHDQGLNGYYDPHLWLDVLNAMDYVRRITDVFITCDPENANYFRTRSKEYLAELAELDLWLLDIVQQIPKPNRKIITYHNAFSYFAQRYGLTVVAFLVVDPDREPNSRQMMELINLLASHPQRVIFTEPQVNIGSRYTDVISKEVGGSVHTLYSGSLTEKIPTYIDMMHYNGETLLEALL